LAIQKKKGKRTFTKTNSKIQDRPMQFEELIDFARKYVNRRISKNSSFLTLLREFSFRKEIRPSMIYKRAHMTRATYSNLINKKYHPSKKAVISIGLALELNQTDMKKLLEGAGYSFNNCFVLDLIVMSCIECKIFNLDMVNSLLVEMGEKPLSSDE
jgi:hypothetical protein